MWDCDIVYNNICIVFWYVLGKKDNLDYVFFFIMLLFDVFVMILINGFLYIFYRCLNGRGYSVVEGGGGRKIIYIIMYDILSVVLRVYFFLRY